MHRFFTLFCAVTAATLSVVGCSSSDDTSSPSSGGSGGSGGAASGGSGGGSSDAQCVGTYSDLSKTALTAATATDGMCPADVATVCSNDVTAKAESCGLDCLASGVTDMDSCVGTCLNQHVSPALSAGCLGCYTADVACARDNCKLKCISATSDACMTCRAQFGCIDSFYSCSGLPNPDATPGAGGTGG